MSDFPKPEKRKRVALSNADVLSGAAAELIMLLETVTADGIVSEREARDLQDWLDDHEVAGLPAIEFLRTLLMHVLEDGRVTEEERKEVYKAIERVLPPDMRQSAKERRQALEVAEKARIRAEAEEKKQAEQQRKAEERERIARAQPVWQGTFQVAGVSHDGRSAVVERFARVGNLVYLQREPSNPYDSNAILVRLEFGQVIGYAPREEASMLAPYLDRGFRQKAAIKWISNGRKYQIPGILVELYREDTTVQDALRPGEVEERLQRQAQATPSQKSIHGSAIPRADGGMGIGCVGWFFIILIALIVLPLVMCGK